MRTRSDLHLFVFLAVVGLALLMALVFLPDHREADAEGMAPTPAQAAPAP